MQLAFGTKRGTAVAFLMQIIHQHFFPEHDTELCDGTNAYNLCSRLQMGEALLTAKSRKIRRQFGYFLMGHRLESKVYVRGMKEHLVLSKAGVRQGDPYAGLAFSMCLLKMLTTMKHELNGKVDNLVISCVASTSRLGPPAKRNRPYFLANTPLPIRFRSRE